MASLIVINGPATGRHFALEQHRLVLVGRDEECTFQILDEQISRKHMHIKLGHEGRHHAIDYGSANGIQVNGALVQREVMLRDGDRIEIGHTTLIYTDEDFTDAEHAREGMRRFGEGRRRTILPET